MIFSSFKSINLCKECGKPVPSKYKYCPDPKCRDAQSKALREKLIRRGSIRVAG